MKSVKDEEYTLTPIIAGQLNLFYFELLAEIKDRAGNLAGYCFVELLPGVFNLIGKKPEIELLVRATPSLTAQFRVFLARA